MARACFLGSACAGGLLWLFGHRPMHTPTYGLSGSWLAPCVQVRLALSNAGCRFGCVSALGAGERVAWSVGRMRPHVFRRALRVCARVRSAHHLSGYYRARRVGTLALGVLACAVCVRVRSALSGAGALL
jgi:hypothetical protein